MKITGMQIFAQKLNIKNLLVLRGAAWIPRGGSGRLSEIPACMGDGPDDLRVPSCPGECALEENNVRQPVPVLGLHTAGTVLGQRYIQGLGNGSNFFSHIRKKNVGRTHTKTIKFCLQETKMLTYLKLY